MIKKKRDENHLRVRLLNSYFNVKKKLNKYTIKYLTRFLDNVKFQNE